MRAVLGEAMQTGLPARPPARRLAWPGEEIRLRREEGANMAGDRRL